MMEDVVEDDEYEDMDEVEYREVEIREQDRFLPIANISRIMKKVLPHNAKVAKDAKESIQECVSEVISFITSEASEKCRQEKRKTINGDDILWAMSTLGFDRYIEPLKIYLFKYRESVRGDKPDKKSSKKLNDLGSECTETNYRGESSYSRSYQPYLPRDGSLLAPSLMTQSKGEIGHAALLPSWGNLHAPLSLADPSGMGISPLLQPTLYLPPPPSNLPSFAPVTVNVKLEPKTEIEQVTSTQSSSTLTVPKTS